MLLMTMNRLLRSKQGSKQALQLPNTCLMRRSVLMRRIASCVRRDLNSFMALGEEAGKSNFTGCLLATSNISDGQDYNLQTHLLEILICMRPKGVSKAIM